MGKATYFEHDRRLRSSTHSEPILYEPRESRKSRKFQRYHFRTARRSSRFGFIAGTTAVAGQQELSRIFTNGSGVPLA